MQYMNAAPSRVRVVRPALCIGLALLTAVAAGSARAPRAEDESKLPPELAQVPADTAAFLSIRVAELWNHPAFEAGKALLARGDDEFLKEIEKNAGVAPGRMERVTIFLRAIGPGGEPAFLVSTSSPYDRKKVLATLGKGSLEEKRKGQILYTDSRSRTGLYFINDRTFASGALGEIQSVVDRPAPATASPLTPALHAAAMKHLAVVGLDIANVKESIGALTEQLPEQFKPLLAVRTATLTLDVAETPRAELKLSFPDESSAKKGSQALKSGLDLARAALLAMSTAPNGPKLSAAEAGLLKSLSAGLESAAVEVSGTVAIAKVTVRTDVKQLSDGLLSMVARTRQAARRTQRANNLKQIALAMHNYHAANGSFPPAAIYDKNGKPLLSWRVLILPYIEQGNLLQEIHLDEPWDSEHNKKLLARVPPTYRSESEEQKPGETFCRGFQGKGAFFEGKKGTRITDITDGTSNTFMVVEAATSVPWTKPDELSFDPSKPLPKLGFREDGFLAAYCDGSVRFIDRSKKEEDLKALVTRNGGEVIKQP